jgi:hypothetical protein
MTCFVQRVSPKSPFAINTLLGLFAANVGVVWQRHKLHFVMADAVLPSDPMLHELQHQILKTRCKLRKKKKSPAARGRLAAELASLEQELQSYVSKQKERREPLVIVVLRERGG